LPHLIKENLAMSTKMEQLLDLLVNEEMDQAHALFHEIIVEKSRTIYENLIAEEAKEEEDEEDEEDEEQDESMEDESDDKVDEETTFEIGGQPEDEEFGGDASDDMISGVSDHKFGGDGEEDDEIGAIGDEPADDSERIDDLEDALEELKMEFEKLMADEENEPNHHDGVDDPDFGDSDDEGDEEGEEDDQEDDEEDDEGFMEDRMITREYVEKVGNDWQTNAMKQQGKAIAANTGEGYPAPVEGRSPVSSGKGKPTTGATAKNLNQGGTGVGEMSGTSPNADKNGRGLVGNTQGEFTKGVTTNLNGKTSGVKTLNKQGSGYPGNNKTPGPVGSGSGDKAGQTSVGVVKSPLNGAPNRNA
jgi:hypothetical protein